MKKAAETMRLRGRICSPGCPCLQSLSHRPLLLSTENRITLPPPSSSSFKDPVLNLVPTTATHGPSTQVRRIAPNRLPPRPPSQPLLRALAVSTAAHAHPARQSPLRSHVGLQVLRGPEETDRVKDVLREEYPCERAGGAETLGGKGAAQQQAGAATHLPTPSLPCPQLATEQGNSDVSLGRESAFLNSRHSWQFCQASLRVVSSQQGRKMTRRPGACPRYTRFCTRRYAGGDRSCTGHTPATPNTSSPASCTGEATRETRRSGGDNCVRKAQSHRALSEAGAQALCQQRQGCDDSVW